MTTSSYDYTQLNDIEAQRRRLQQQAEALRREEVDLLREAGLREHHVVVEIGAGLGFVTDILAEAAAQGVVHAVEPDPAAAAQIDGHVRRKPSGGVQVHVAPGDRVPLPAHCADFVYIRFVLQHVSDPTRILQEAARLAKPGGVVCTVDSDDGLLVLEPEPVAWEELMQRVREKQRALGGDRFAGRRLCAWLHAAGCQAVQSRVIVRTTTELPWEVWFNIALGYKLRLLEDAARVEEWKSSLGGDVQAGRLWAAAGVVVAYGRVSDTPEREPAAQ